MPLHSKAPTCTVAIALLVPLLLGTTPVMASTAPGKKAQADPNEARAMDAYRLGTELYNDAKFEEALEAFEEAATLYASPAFQFNIAKCHERLGNLQEAVRHYETYLRTTDDSPDRAVIESTIEGLKKRIEEEKEAANKPDPGPGPGPVGPDPAELAAEQERKDGLRKAKTMTIAGGVLVGVGAAVALGGGIGFGLPVLERNTKLGDVQNNGNPDRLTFAEAEALDQQARSLFLGEIVMIAAGSAVAVTGVALLAVGVTKKKKIKGSALRFSPALGPQMVGLRIGGRF